MFLTKWKESLDIFEEKELKPFILASLNTFKRSSLLIFKYFWWLIGIFLVFVINFFDYQNANILNKTNKSLDAIFYFGFVFFSYFIFDFLVTLACRPSLENKNFRYFVKNTQKFFYFFIFNSVLFVLNFSFFSKYLNIFYFVGAFFAFFYLDNQKSVSTIYDSIVNGFKFCFYFLPVILIFGLFLNIFLYLPTLLFFSLNFLNGIYQYIVLAFGFIFTFIFLFLIKSFLAVFYNRMKYREHNLFFKK